MRKLARPDPVLLVDLLQSGKAALAGAVAWVVAAEVLGLEQPFLAPWAAVLVVHATIYRTVSRGGQQVLATIAGVVIAWGCGRAFGVDAVSMGVMLLVAFLLGRHRWLREEAMTIATTGIVVLATNALFRADLLVSRLVDTAVGVGVGLLVNLLVWPPLRDRAAWARADELPGELAEVLSEMATGLGPDLHSADVETWVQHLQRIDERLAEAWNLLGEARESVRMNPRPSQPTGLEDQRRILQLLEQALADSMSMARTIAVSAENATLWDPAFRASWRRLLEDSSAALRKLDHEGLRDIEAELGRLADALSTDALPGSAWHEYGGLLVNLRNVLRALTEVVRTQVRVHPSARRRRRPLVRGRLQRRREGRGLAGRGAGYSGRDDDSTP
jgi:hypothetical protein